MQELAGRVNDLENQLSEALSKLQSGAYITKDMLIICHYSQVVLVL